MEEFLGSGAAAPALVLTGGPGIGKTALWEAGLGRAGEQGFCVLAARPDEAQARHSFAALFDLLEGADGGALGALPAPQRRALEVAVLRSEPEPAAAAEPFAVAAGFLGVLRGLAAARPLLLAADDLHWLDAASSSVLAFTARRLHGPRCRFLLARRSGRPVELERALRPAGISRVEVGPLSLSSTHLLLSRRLGLAMPRRTLSQVFDVTRGNPLLALELGRALAGRENLDSDLDLLIADRAGNPFGARVAGLARPARQALLAAALGGHMSLGLLSAVADPAACEDLVTAGLLITDGWRVRTAHPLLAAAARRQSSAKQRRAMHLILAESAGDPVLRARYLALAATGKDAGLAEIIAAAATTALRRGAAHDAADLAGHALRLTPPESAEFLDRLLAVAECLITVGEPPRARELLAPRIGELPAGGARARAHLLLGEAGDAAEHEYHLEEALAASAEPALRATALATKSMLLSSSRLRPREAQACAEQALVLARSAGTATEWHALQALAWARILRGQPVGNLSRHVSAPPERSGLYESSIDRPTAVRLAFRGQIAEARAVFRRLWVLADERGEYRFGAVLQIQMCELELRAGDVRECARLLEGWDEWAAMEDVAVPRARCRAMLAAIEGRPEESERRAATAMAALAAASQDPAYWRWDQLEIWRAQGIAALAAHQPEQAASALGAVWEHTRLEGVDDPGAFPVAPDLVEALLRLGRTDKAAEVTGQLSDLAERQCHPWGIATANRCAAAVALNSGYGEDHAARLSAAAADLGELGLGFDRARSLLWLGQAARRARKHGAARGFLEAAAIAFDGLGSGGWAGQARSELTRLGAHGPARAGQLTAAEQRAASLAADGLSNKEIAHRLFITVHTVEVHLARAYAKLGVRSRTQLAARLAARRP